MKTYYLRLVTEDFAKSDNTWTSGIIDFYDGYSDASEMATPSYRNYSTIKSNFGLNSLGNDTYTGFDQLSATETEIGIVDGDRFIDYSGRIDVVDYSITFSTLDGTADVNCALDLYTIDDATAAFPDEWAYKAGVTNLTYIGETSSYRYGKIVLRLSSDQDFSAADVELIVMVRIGEPLQGKPSYKSVRDIQNKFPEWMAVREIENEEPATPELATPTSLSGMLLSAVAGEWLDDIRDDIAYAYAQQFINTADVNQKAWVYIVADVPDAIYQISGDGIELSRCANVEDFYDLTDDEYGFWHDDIEDVIFLNRNYDEFLVNYEQYTPSSHQIWNWFDEFGLKVDLSRHYLETNEYFKGRILDVFINKPGVGVEAFKLALRRELSLWQYFQDPVDSTPDSYFAGATPEVYEIEDLETHTDFVGLDGVPTQKFISLIESLAKEYPSTWGNFVWGKATYDAGGQEGEGYAELARRYDATPLADDDTQSGIGDGNDLFVYRPDEVTGAREFTGRVKLRGRQKQLRDEYRKITFDVNIWGEVPYTKYENPDTTAYFTIELAVTGKGTIRHIFSLTTNNGEQSATPTDNSIVEHFFMTHDGQSIPGMIWVDSTGGEHMVGASYTFTWADITSCKLYNGNWHYNGGSPYYAHPPTSDTYTAWLSGSVASLLEYADGSTPITIDSGSTPLISAFHPVSVSMESKETASSTDTWASEKHRYTVSINGALNGDGLQSFTVPAPSIIWHPYETGTRTYKLQIVTTDADDSSSYGGYTTDVDGSNLFIPATYIQCNGSSTWLAGQKTFTISTTEFVFEAVDQDATPVGSLYPVQNCPYWELFEYDCIDHFTGVVDENGPWRNGIAPMPGNSNYNLETMLLTRDDFGIPNSEDYVVTWIGVDCLDNGRVMLWLDSNIVHPSFDDGTTVTYPDSAVDETEDGGVYSYGPFVVRARLNPNIPEQWYPQVHSGWFYDRNDEYYFYATPSEETATITSDAKILSRVARQGAPIIVKSDESTPVDYRQVAFWDDATPGFTLYATQTVYGTGSTVLYVGYEDIYDITVTNLNTGQSVAAVTYSETNEITTSDVTDVDHEYQILYKVNRSFYADHEYIDTDDQHKTRIVFDQELDRAVNIDYEISKFDPATPVDLPLSTFYTVLDEGFIYISHNEYDLDKVEVRISPSSIIADGEDYLIVTLRSLDTNGNPKPNATFNLATSFGTLDYTTVTTNDDGFAVVKLLSDSTNTDLSGLITVSGDVSATVNYHITPKATPTYALAAVPNVQQIPADGNSSVELYGKVEDDSHNPIPYAVVYWRKGRYMEEIWTQQYSTDSASPGWDNTAGRVVADENGVFNVGPFMAATPWSPGYWMVALESETSSPNYSSSPDYYGATPNGWNAPATPDWELAGDVVFWTEYIDTIHGVENLNGLPRNAVQLSDRTETIPDMATSGAYAWPTFYDEATPLAPATPMAGDILYSPSKWYAIDRYRQYQLGLLGSSREPTSVNDLTESYPDYREF